MQRLTLGFPGLFTFRYKPHGAVHGGGARIPGAFRHTPGRQPGGRHKQHMAAAKLPVYAQDSLQDGGFAGSRPACYERQHVGKAGSHGFSLIGRQGDPHSLLGVHQLRLNMRFFHRLLLQPRDLFCRILFSQKAFRAVYVPRLRGQDLGYGHHIHFRADRLRGDGLMRKALIEQLIRLGTQFVFVQV